MSEEDRKLQKHLVDEMMKVSESNPDVMFYMESLMKKYEELEQKVEQLENKNFNIRENIHLERISLPPELTKDKDFMELYDIPSYKDLQQKVEQLEEEVNEYQKELEKADSITQSCIFQGKQESKISFRKCLNRLEQLENIRKEAIEEIQRVLDIWTNKPNEIATLDLEYLLNILNKGGISKYEV